MKIYFSGALRASSNDWHTYGQLIEHLKKHGKVLTQHFNHGVFAIGKSNGMSDEEIFELYMNLIEKADVFVQEVSTPSIGVGFETAKAQQLEKPILCLYKPNSARKLSVVLGGNKHITLKTYSTVQEAFGQINSFFEEIKKKRLHKTV